MQTVGFTLCVSAAVETTGWIHTQQRQRDGYSADGGGGQTLAKLGVPRARGRDGGTSLVTGLGSLRRCFVGKQTVAPQARFSPEDLPLSSPQPDLLAPG